MTHSVTVPVTCPAAQARSYDIVIGAGQLSQTGALLAARFGRRRCIIVTDNIVAQHYLTACRAAVSDAGHQVLADVVVPAGEGHKNFTTLQTILDQILAAGVDRKTLLIALGGGVVGDMVGLAAALAMRGIDFVQVPTTLLAQVDSAVGGKTAIDTAHGKNTVGAFHQPLLVVSDTDILSTLPLRERRAGYAEIVKYGLINNAAFFTWCEHNGARVLVGEAEALRYAIAESCQMKAAIVEQDEKEAGVRALLNLGHTFGHALETHLGYDPAALLHGEAVAIGMVLAFRLSAAMGLCFAADVDRITRHFSEMGLPTCPPAAITTNDTDHLLELMATDKKAEAGQLTLILARGIGESFVAKNVDRSAVRQIWLDVLGD